MGTETKAAQMAGKWWAKLLQKGDKEQFAKETEQRVLSQLQKSECKIPGVYLECDYDPQGILLEAVNAIGIKCGGYMFSARGILPRKHSLFVTKDKLVPKEGYGNWTEEIAVI